MLDGRYQLIEAIGAGGFGQVWAAHDPKIDRLVAVKVLTGDAGSSRQVAGSPARPQSPAASPTRTSSPSTTSAPRHTTGSPAPTW